MVYYFERTFESYSNKDKMMKLLINNKQKNSDLFSIDVVPRDALLNGIDPQETVITSIQKILL